ncbi:hypothetical protein IU403_01985 [Aerococcaceae bacterium zg-BR22]|uniref:hypothetical protein n=1 Tax=Aerococcaceae bacterium zg-1292 TaxID=2774330 RepID=UPI0040640605|nr:hypothetical protein [Aerococcaceae bacterium zg-BR22]
MTFNIIDILEKIKLEIESLNPIDKKYLVSKGNQNGFELLVPLIAEKIKISFNDTSVFDYTVHLGHHFPDMDLYVNGKKYGLELKSRNNGSWDTNGNSVFESITDDYYDDIYILFGSKEPHVDHILIRYNLYWKVTSAINVTHSPRFKINMNSESSVFSSADEYYSLRDKDDTEKAAFLQNYLKENTTGVKWFVPQDTSTGSIKPTSLNSLSTEIQNQVKAQILVLYPQDIITTTRASYHRAHEFIISTHYYYSSSFRDFFSAGGKWAYNNILFPQSVGTYFKLSQTIKNILLTANDDFKDLAYSSWKDLNLNLSRESFINDYKIVIDYIGSQHFSKELSESSLVKLSNCLI